jgi:hypothetical protein
MHKFSIIYKHIQAMHNELRYQAKRHVISEKLLKEKIKILHFLPHFFFHFFFMFEKKNRKTMNTYLWRKDKISIPSM